MSGRELTEEKGAEKKEKGHSAFLLREFLFGGMTEEVFEKNAIHLNLTGPFVMLGIHVDEYLKLFEEADGFVKIMWCGERECEDKIKELTSATIRCIPFEEENLGDKCCVCGKAAKHMIYTGKQY